MDPETRIWVKGVSLGGDPQVWGNEMRTAGEHRRSRSLLQAQASGGPRNQYGTPQNRCIEDCEGGICPHGLKFALLPFPWAKHSPAARGSLQVLAIENKNAGPPVQCEQVNNE